MVLGEQLYIVLPAERTENKINFCNIFKLFKVLHIVDTAFPTKQYLKKIFMCI